MAPLKIGRHFAADGAKIRGERAEVRGVDGVEVAEFQLGVTALGQAQLGHRLVEERVHAGVVIRARNEG
jgi:hypothetical protein